MLRCMPSHAISVRDLAFIRDVLIPRAWVQGTEVDEFLRLRARIDRILSDLQRLSASSHGAPPDPPLDPASTGRKKKPRHPKKRRGPQPHPDGN